MKTDDPDIAHALLCDPEDMRYAANPMTPAAVVEHIEKQATRRGARGLIGIWAVSCKETGRKIVDDVLPPVPIDDDDIDWSQVLPERHPNAQV